MKITNQKTKVDKDIFLNDEDYLNRLLFCLKELSKLYQVALTEFSNEQLYSYFKKDLDNVLKLQRETFEVMFVNGWYELSTVDNSEINTKIKNYTTEFDALIQG